MIIHDILYIMHLSCAKFLQVQHKEHTIIQRAYYVVSNIYR